MFFSRQFYFYRNKNSGEIVYTIWCLICCFVAACTVDTDQLELTAFVWFFFSEWNHKIFENLMAINDH